MYHLSDLFIFQHAAQQKENSACSRLNIVVRMAKYLNFFIAPILTAWGMVKLKNLGVLRRPMLTDFLKIGDTAT